MQILILYRQCRGEDHDIFLPANSSKKWLNDQETQVQIKFDNYGSLKSSLNTVRGLLRSASTIQSLDYYQEFVAKEHFTRRYSWVLDNMQKVIHSFLAYVRSSSFNQLHLTRSWRAITLSGPLAKTKCLSLSLYVRFVCVDTHVIFSLGNFFEPRLPFRLHFKFWIYSCLCHEYCALFSSFYL